MHTQAATTSAGGRRRDDPFHWSPERLVTELCTADRCWEAPPPRKWPDPDRLAGKLRMHDLDGEDLITVQDVAGYDGFDSLCRELGIVKIPHKMSLLSAIQVFQFRSPAYRAWKAARAAQSQMSPEPPEPEKLPERSTKDTAATASGFTTPKRDKAKGAAFATPRSSPLRLSLSSPSAVRGVPQGDLGTVVSQTLGRHSSPALPTVLSPLTSEKRKRVAPTNISAVRENRAGRTFGDAAESNFFAAPNDVKLMWQTSIEGAFLGSSKLTQHDVLHTYDPLDPHAQENDESLDDAYFIWVARRPIPEGRRLQVHRIMRRFLRPRRSTLNLGRGRPSAENAGTNQELGDDDDVVLPLLGESDDDEEYDSETWEAMLKEEHERNNPQPRKNVPLPVEMIDAIIADVIQDMETKWVASKLPGLRRREHTLWAAARRSGSRKWRASAARVRAETLGRRIEKLVREIRSGEYKSETELRRLTPSLEASVVDKRRAMWEARLYARPTEPPKPKTAGRLDAQRPRTQHRVADDDSETLTGSSDEDMRDFVTDDEARVSLSPDAEDRSTKAPSWSLDPMEVDTVDNSASPLTPVKEPRARKDTNSTAIEPQMRNLTNGPLENAAAIAEKGDRGQKSKADIKQLLLSMLESYDEDQLSRLFAPGNIDEHASWEQFVVPALSATARITDDAVAFSRLFYVYLTCQAISAEEFYPVEAGKEKLLREKCHRIEKFCALVRTLLPRFTPPVQNEVPLELPSFTKAKKSKRSKEANRRVPNPDAEDGNNSDVWLVGDSPDIEVLAIQPVQQHDTDVEDVADVQTTPSRRRKRPFQRDKDAQDLRDKDRERLEAQENRRKALYEKLAQSSNISEGQSRLIINTAKEDHHGLVYISRAIGEQIRDHQIEGVRFMWNQLIVPSAVRQGCLLAHTMGLGKTMQVITLLVAVAEAALSPDATVVSQIPEDLRESKTLILCPSGLVQNWLDELLRWVPGDLLGKYYYVSADTAVEERFRMVERWADGGKGVLVVGYTMFRRLVEDYGDELRQLLEKLPSIVIADEAHALKNPKSKVHEATANFATMARIAMTGSPLANAVEEYHSMINWVAPNYLADHREFVGIYANPIKEGFYKDSTSIQRRRAIRMLKVLKDTVAPKIHRATVAALKGELPPKTEFILYLPLTELQLAVYRTFIDSVRRPAIMGDINTTVQLWNILVNLTLLLAHPKVFQIRLKEMHAALVRASQRAPRPAGDKKRENILPPDTIHELLAAVRQRDIDNIEHSPKVVVLIGILDEARRMGDKVLVFSQSKLVLDYLEEMCKRQQRRYSRLDGDTAVSLRQTMVSDFNTGNDEIYLISTTAGGVGLNIQGANRVVIFDFKWNPMHEQQAVGRAYRIGQAKPVFVYWLITGGTCETVLHNQAVFKTQLASRVVDKKNPSAWAKQMRDYTREPTVMEPDETIPARFGGRDRVLDALLGDETRKHCICKIVSTDTFEEEEPEDKLSAEELRETAALVFQNRTGIRNPEDAAKAGVAYVSPFLKEHWPAMEASVAPGGPGGPGGAGAPGAQNDPVVSAWRTHPVILDAKERTAAAAHAATSAALATSTAAKSGLVSWAPVTGSMRPVISQPAGVHGGPNDGPSGPALAGQLSQARIGHYVGGQQAMMGMQPEPVVLGLNNEYTPPGPPGLPGRSTLLATKDDLESVLVERLVTNRVDPITAHSVAARKVAAIASHFRQTGVPAAAQWARLRNRASSDNRFVAAMATGDVSPKLLATMTIPEEEAMVKYLHARENGLESQHEEATQEAALAAPSRASDPDHVTAHMQRVRDRLVAQQQEPGGHNAGDLDAIEQVIAQRRRKHQHQRPSPPQPEPQPMPLSAVPAGLPPQPSWPPAMKAHSIVAKEARLPPPSPAMAHARIPQWTTSQASHLPKPKPKIKSRVRSPPGGLPVGPPVGPPTRPPAEGPQFKGLPALKPPTEKPLPPEKKIQAEKQMGSNPQDPYVLDDD